MRPFYNDMLEIHEKIHDVHNKVLKDFIYRKNIYIFFFV
jgi:hypothetical protein